MIRLVLIPITNGPDFEVWDIASRATLRWQNIYANHPRGYPGGPLSYLPLFLYVELPFQWISMHAGIPFRVLGKLPILTGDLVVALAIVAELRRRGRSEAVQAFGAALWFLNPLVLYNSAWYGRFDSVCVALLVLAVIAAHDHRGGGVRLTDRSSVLVGAAIAAKLFPVVVVPWLVWRSKQRVRSMLIIAGVCIVVSLPYLLASPGALVYDVVRYNSDKPPNGLTWQTALRFSGASDASMALVRDGMIVLSAGAMWVLRRRSVWVFAPIAIGCFLLTSNIVLEQYLMWSFPFLIVLALSCRARPAAFLLAWLTLAGIVMNHDIHPLGRQGVAGTTWFNVVLAVGLIAGLTLLSIEDRSPRTLSASQLTSAVARSEAFAGVSPDEVSR